MRGTAAVLLALFLSGTTGATVAHAQIPVFVEGEPFGARIELDGAPMAAKTPALLFLEPGSYTLSLSREDHEGVTRTLTVPEQGYVEVDPRLPAEYVLIDLPEEERHTEALPDGTYRFSRGGERYLIRPEYGREGRLRAFRAVTTTLTGAAVASTLWSFLAPPEDRGVALTPTVTLQIGSLLFAVLTTEQQRQKERFLRTFEPPADPYRPVQAAALAERAEEEIRRGDLDGGSRAYEKLLRDHPDAPSVPQGLYTLGRLAVLSGDYEAAEGHLERLLAEYPVREFYDRTLLQRARVEFERGNVERAEEILARRTGTDTQVTAQTVEALRAIYGLDEESAE